MECPGCGGELKTEQKFGQGVWRCVKCGYSWFILKLRKGASAATRYNFVTECKTIGGVVSKD
ncbi:hypothetical protein A2Z67_04635 [Candidatus Woesebacteria bacterium RBG_13_36_22]|uniref:Uncharacterized protein n=1 Tax=Candidatus Woesebacteria bacterium RBG_13_36_22 TaxID=1802478 RepID=A0A1F7X3C8_9BACT|nr:MAG: hypothetical protein A2Z67_04635 [Candidatus Woesebacteria bacterium RBG_13_36_22]